MAILGKWVLPEGVAPKIDLSILSVEEIEGYHAMAELGCLLLDSLGGSCLVPADIEKAKQWLVDHFSPPDLVEQQYQQEQEEHHREHSL